MTTPGRQQKAALDNLKADAGNRPAAPAPTAAYNEGRVRPARLLRRNRAQINDAGSSPPDTLESPAEDGKVCVRPEGLRVPHDSSPKQ